VRPTSPTWRLVVPTTHQVVTIVDSYLGGSALAQSIPITSGTITYDATAKLQRRCTITVPARDGLTVWDPGGDPAHPLAAYGQRLHIRTGMVLPGGITELMDHGWYLITDWSRSDVGGDVTVQGYDLMRLVEDAALYAPYTTSTATFTSAATDLAGGILPVAFDSGLTNRGTGDLLVDRDRLGGLESLAASWPARMAVDDTGAIAFTPPYSPVTEATVPNVVFADGENGTVVDRQRSSGRDRLHNAVVVTGEATAAAAPPRAVAELTTGPLAVTGPFGRSVRFFSSPLITTNSYAQDTANALLAQSSLLGRTETVYAVPDPSVQLGDVARVYTRGDSVTGRVQSIVLPLTALSNGGMMTLAVATDAALDQNGDSG